MIKPNVDKEVTALLVALGLNPKPESGSSISFLLFNGFYDQLKIKIDVYCDQDNPLKTWVLANES